jgi:hypothetical protein
MLTFLIEELNHVGLHLNVSKTKLLTNAAGHHRQGFSSVVRVAGSYMHLLGPHEWHKYLGRRLSFCAQTRADTEVSNRIEAAWGQFHKRRRTFTNTSITFTLRMKLFGSTVTPCILYGLGAITLTGHHLDLLDRLQRRMLRLIVRWVRLPEEPWSDTMRRMRERVQSAMVQCGVQTWSHDALARKWRWAGKVARMSEDRWPKRVATWDPRDVPQHGALGRTSRRRGRPRRRWEDDLNEFSLFLGRNTWWEVASGCHDAEQWEALLSDFVRYVRQ